MSGTYSFCVRTSWSTAWRCEKVPRPESWPESRTGTPSSSSVPKPSASPVAQSTSPLPSSSSARLRTNGSSLGWISIPSGTVPSALSVVLSRPHIAEASTGAGGVRLAAPDRGERRLGFRALGLHLGLLRGPERVERLARDRALAHQLVAVERRRRGVVLDARVHDRLRVARLVGLVVAPAPVADEVDHHVLLELLAVLEREARDVGDRLRVVAVHVQRRRVDHLGDVGRVGGAARVLGQRREADLVVDDHVDRAAGAVAVEPREVHRLGHDALAGEGGVAVEQQRQHVRVLLVAHRVLLGPHHALDHRVHELEVARVRARP